VVVTFQAAINMLANLQGPTQAIQPQLQGPPLDTIGALMFPQGLHPLSLWQHQHCAMMHILSVGLHGL